MNTQTIVDDHAVTELDLFIENDGDLYRSIILPTCKAMAKKVCKGVYDEHKGFIQWTRVATVGAKKYGAEHLSEGEWFKAFTVNTRQAVAAMLMESYQEHVDEMIEDIFKARRS